MVAALCVGLHGTCLAHPFGDRYAGQRLDLRLDPAGITVGLVLDLPGPLLRSIGEAPDDLLARAPLGVVITIDNETLPVVVQSSTRRSDLLQPDTVILEAILRADVPLTGMHDIEVNNGNLMGLPGWYADTIQTTASMQVLSSSLAIPMKDGTTELLDGRWSQSELRRRVKVEVDGRGTPWHPVVSAIEGQTWQPLETSLPAPWTQRWTSGSHGYTGSLLITLWTLCTSFFAGMFLADDDAKSPPWLRVCVVGGLALVLPVHAGIAAGILVMCSLMALRWPLASTAAATTAMVTGIALSWGPWTPPLTLLAVAGIVLGSRIAPRTWAAAPLVLAGVAALLRAPFL